MEMELWSREREPFLSHKVAPRYLVRSSQELLAGLWLTWSDNIWWGSFFGSLKLFGAGKGMGVRWIFCSVSGVENMIMSWQLWPPGCQTDPSTPFGGHSWNFRAPVSSRGLENSFMANTWRLFFSTPLGQRYRSCFSWNVCDEHFESAGWEVTLCLYCIDACWLLSNVFCQPPTFPGFVTKEGCCNAELMCSS